ncbi:MAG: lysylphosphatidylglycerol synthase transmembrane domain-containing protein [bacterium]|nr:lysylphosphatidylglycerol synthase transmembrane domain-containing protein [bacterium]
MKKTLAFILRLLVALGLLFILARSIDLAEAVRLTKEMNLIWAGLAFLLIMGLRVIMAIRWKVILNSQMMVIPLGYLIRITYISMSVGQLLPGGVGPDLFRGFALNRQKEGRLLDITTTILIDRFMGIFSIFIVALAGASVAYFIGLSTGLVSTLLLMNALIVAAWYLSPYLRTLTASIPILQRGKLKKINLLFQALTDKERVKKIFVKIFSLSVFVQGCRIAVFYCLYLAYGSAVDLVYYMVFIPILYVATVIPVSVGGLGVREGTLVYFFSTLHVPAEVSVSVGIVYHLLHLLGALPGVVLWFLDKHRQGETWENALNNSP